MALHDLIADLGPLLTNGEDASVRQRALEQVKEYLLEHASELDKNSVLCLGEFLVLRLKASDCLEQVEEILSILIGFGHRELCTELLSAYSPDLSVKSRIVILNVLSGRILDDASMLTLLLTAIRGEKDPVCLFKTFKIVTAASASLDDHLTEQVFEAFCNYFPITFKSFAQRAVSEEELRESLRLVFSMSPVMTHLSIPFVNEKLAACQSASVGSECLKVLRECFKNTDQPGVTAYFRESTNLAFSMLERCASEDDHLSDPLCGLLSDTFVQIPHDACKEYADLFCQHILHLLSSSKTKPSIYNMIPGLIRHVGSANSIVTGVISDTIIEKRLFQSAVQLTNVEWACILGFLCAAHDTGYKLDCVSDLVRLLKIQTEKFTDPKASKNDLVFAVSFVEAVFRDSLCTIEEILRLQVLKSVLSCHRLNVKIDEAFLAMILTSLINSQRTLIINNVSEFVDARLTAFVKLIAEDVELLLLFVDDLCKRGMDPVEYIKRCELSSISKDKRIQWLLSLDKLGFLGPIDLIVCSLPSEELLEYIDELTHAKPLVFLALPPEKTKENLNRIELDEELEAALWNKLDYRECRFDTDYAWFLKCRALIIKQCVEGISLIDKISSDDLKAQLLIDSCTNRIDSKHRFIQKPFYKQWFLNQTFSDSSTSSSSYSADLKLAWIMSCDVAVIDSEHVEPIVLQACGNVQQSPRLVDFINWLLSHHESLSILSLPLFDLVTRSIAKQYTMGLKAIKCLNNIFSALSPSVLLLHVNDYVRLLQPWLGDKRAIVRKYAVRCLDQLYASQLE